MKKILILFLFITVTAFGQEIPFKPQKDEMILGKGANAIDKSIQFDVGDGGTNPKIIVDETLKDFDFNKNVKVTGDMSATGNVLGVNGTFTGPVSGTTGTFTGDNFTVGDGTDTAKKFIFDIGSGASNPFFKWDSVGSSLLFSNDGTIEKKIGSGSGAGGGGGILLIENVSFEDLDAGAAVFLNWTNTGGTLTQEAYTNGSEGNLNFARFVASGVGQFVESDLITVPSNINGGCMAGFLYNQGDNSFEYKVLDSGNNDISVGFFSDLTSFQEAPIITLPCKDGEQYKLRVISTAAGTIDLDNAYLGSNKGFIASSTVEKLTEKILSADYSATGDAPDLTFTNLIIGRKYRINGQVWINSFSSSTVGVNFRGGALATGTIHGAVTFHNGNASSISNMHGVSFSFVADSTNLYTNRFGPATPIHGNGTKAQTYLQLTELPESGQEAFTPEQADFFIDVNIGGGNVTLSTTAVPLIPENSSLDMVLNRGSSKIPCSGGNTSTGLTCSSGLEQVGVVFNAPRSGDYEVCMSVIANSISAVAFRLVETNSNSDTIIQTGNNLSASSVIQDQKNICEVFQFSSTGEKTVKLAYELISSGNIIADRNASEYERDMHITVKLVSHNVSRPIIQNMVDTGVASGIRKESCKINNNGTATIDTLTGLCESWIESVTRTGIGIVSTIYKVGIFSSKPSCISSPNPSNNINGGVNNQDHSLRSIQTVTEVGNTAADFDVNFNITCTGKR